MAETAVVAVARAVEAVFVFLATPEGQESLRRMREDGDKFRADVEKLWALIRK